MNKIAICFDVDGTLINEDKENLETIALLEAFCYQSWKNVDIFVWSGGGKKYAETIGHRLELPSKVKYASKLEVIVMKDKYDKIMTIDDQHAMDLGDVNLIVRNK